MDIHFAPLQGYVDTDYRRLHAQHYPGIKTYYTPFIRVEKGEARKRDIARLQESMEDGQRIVPQIIFGSVSEFTLLTNELRGLGVEKIDLNLGCPYPMQTKRGRGAALIAETGIMSEVCDLIAKDSGIAYSVKMRLGLKEQDEWKQLMPILNETPLSHITVHPRVAGQMYGGELFLDSFRELESLSRWPVVYNGDIKTFADLTECSDRDAVMIGRGLLARPSLATEWQEGREWSRDERMANLRAFHADFMEACQARLCGDAMVLQRLKAFWEYMEPEIGRKAWKAIHKAGSMAKYRAAAESALQRLDV